MWWCLMILVTCAALEAHNNVFYNNFYGTPVGEEEMMYYIKQNTSSICTTEIKPCDPFEGRRLDGTCNNLEHPSRGASRTPFIRLLPANYGEGFGPRLSESGLPLPPERHLRTSILATGTLPDQTFTQLSTLFFVTMTQDLLSVEDPENFILPSEKTFCCLPEGKIDPMCACLKVPEDDPTLRYTNIRGLDLTIPISFQSTGCLRSGTSPERFVTSTPVFDLSQVYGNELGKSLKSRLYSRGLLKYDVEDGRVYPPQRQTKPSFCVLNELPRETRCHDTPDDTSNGNIAHNLNIIWFWRNHNRIASTLADLNPCWSDERIFQTARDINIATIMQIFFYEFLPLIFGREYLLRDSILSPDLGFRDVYDNNIMPQLSLEFPYVLRWAHLMIDGRFKMYDGEGKYLKQIPLVNLTLRTGYLAVDDNIDHMTQGTFRQASGKIDTMVDPDMVDRVFGPLKPASDVFSIDLARGRHFGFQPYIKYRELCSGRSYKTFDDLADLIDNDKLEVLEEVYGNVNDVELIAGLWVEKSIMGRVAPPTVYCVAVEQLLRSIKSDRHWYERANRPNAFTLQQLQEIRKATISGLLCEVADKVTNIQRTGFVRSGPRNKMTSCSKIPKNDLYAWKDYNCARQ